MGVHTVHRAEHDSDILTHQLGGSDLKQGLQRMECHTPLECLGHPWVHPGAGQTGAEGWALDGGANRHRQVKLKTGP